ncbi:MAG: maleylacetoacetate isomerase [Deltaproteobacteria bacterium]|nr:maleylacetoacetate isomerase [Deltaproteobacteria bacterium]
MVTLKLHNYWRSSASHRVRIALGLKGLAYEYVVVNILKSEQHASGYTTKNPMGQVPTLELEDGRMLSQSLPIMEYLDEAYAEPPILPLDPYLRAKCRALAEIVNSGIQPLQNLTTTNQVTAFGGDAGVWPRKFITDGVAAFERAIGDGPFCCGDFATIADCCLIPQLASARRFGVDITTYPRLLAIEERCLAMPAFANAAPDRQPDAVRTK